MSDDLASDVPLLIGILRHRPEALAGVYERHGAAVLDLATEVCGADEADAVAQDVFLRLWRHPDEASAEHGSLRSHLLAVAHAGAVERVRRRPAGWRVPAHDHRSLEVLSVGPRRAISLVYYGGCTSDGAATALGISKEEVCREISDGLDLLHLVAEETALEGTS